ncbi:MAG: hypothetical protein ACXW1M_05400, partial [Acidimicrobiia bacterium]
MLLAAPNIRQALSADYDPTIIAEDGRRIDEMLPPLRRALRDDTPVAAVIANLGTNNAIQGRTYSRTIEDFDRLVEATEPV